MKRVSLLLFCTLLVSLASFAQNRARMISGVNYQPGPTYLFLAADSKAWCNERSPKAQT
jgi:hypothetical protein